MAIGARIFRSTSLMRTPSLLGPYSRIVSSPVVVLGEGAVPYERGTPVTRIEFRNAP